MPLGKPTHRGPQIVSTSYARNSFVGNSLTIPKPTPLLDKYTLLAFAVAQAVSGTVSIAWEANFDDWDDIAAANSLQATGAYAAEPKYCYRIWWKSVPDAAAEPANYTFNIATAGANFAGAQGHILAMEGTGSLIRSDSHTIILSDVQDLDGSATVALPTQTLDKWPQLFLTFLWSELSGAGHDLQTVSGTTLITSEYESVDPAFLTAVAAYDSTSVATGHLPAPIAPAQSFSADVSFGPWRAHRSGFVLAPFSLISFGQVRLPNTYPDKYTITLS
jgi:hypothetical protein